MPAITAILNRIQAGDSHASSELLPLVYNELRRIAGRHMKQERPGHVLQPTALVNEAWMRLSESLPDGRLENRQQFFAAASESMRRILVDMSRRKAAMKRGGGFTEVALDDSDSSAVSKTREILEVSDALESLQQEDQIAAELVKLHYFAGFSIEESAEILSLSRATAYRIWGFSKAFLRVQLSD